VNEKEPLIDQQSRDIVREDVLVIEGSLNFVNDLLRSMLDLHRAKSNQLALHPVLTDMKRDILEPVATMIYRRDEAFEVLVECPEELVFTADSLRLKQVVLNLARNSAKFVENGFVRLRADKVGSSIRIYVEDSGPGIPHDKRDQLFAKFQESLDSLSQGTGIGLSLCRKLIDLMNGTICLDVSYHSGIEGQPGAKFDISIPWPSTSPLNQAEMIIDGSTETTFRDIDDDSCRRDADVESVTQSEPVMTDSNVSTLTHLPELQRILFVDDDMVLRKLFLRSVRRACPQWSVSEASNGETALLLTEKEKFDIIFIDQYMTSIEKQLLGTEATRLMRSKGVESIICGLSANDQEAVFLNAGANAFMIKPFPCKTEPLLEELRRVYNCRR
jgi:CheY-like chemotaxis protein